MHGSLPIFLFWRGSHVHIKIRNITSSSIYHYELIRQSMPRKKTKKPPNAYHAHRERQRRRILDAAWKLLDERGIDRVTMAEITASSGVQPSTMYQYFSNKDDIVWAILGELMREVSGRAKHPAQRSGAGFAFDWWVLRRRVRG